MESLDNINDLLSQNQFHEIIGFISYILSAYILIYLGKMIFKMVHSGIDVSDQLVEKDNLAFSIAYAGYLAGLLCCAGGAIIGPSKGIIYDDMSILSYGLLGIVLLNLSMAINDRLILSKMNVWKEITEKENTAAGLTNAAFAIGSGLIIMGAISGEGGGFLTAVVFWCVAQFILIVTVLVYDAITPYKIQDHILKKNEAVGIGYLGAIIAISILIWFSDSEDFYTWEDAFYNLALYTGVGLIFLPLMRWFTDSILLPGQKLTDEIINQEHPNHGAAIIEAFSYIGGALLLVWCF